MHQEVGRLYAILVFNRMVGYHAQFVVIEEKM
jgi:hypothetical protein